MSKTVTVRFQDSELAMLDSLAPDKNANRSETLRYLIIKEFARRHGQRAPREAAYRSDMRVGRPSSSSSCEKL